MANAEKVFDEGDILSGDHPRYRYASMVYSLTPPNAQPFRASARHRAYAFVETFGLLQTDNQL